MPFLFSFVAHNALQEVQVELLPGEWLFAFLDDVYALSTPERSRYTICWRTGWNRATKVQRGWRSWAPMCGTLKASK